MKRICYVLLVSLMACSLANADLAWTGGGDGTSWNDKNNWDGTNIPGNPPNAYTTDVYSSATINLNCNVSDYSSLKLTNGAAQTVVLNLNGPYTFRYNKAQTQNVYLGQTGNATINQYAGTFMCDANGSATFTQGEIRIGDSQAANCTGTYNLYGGTLDTCIFKKKTKTTSGMLNCYGGTLAIRNSLYNMGNTATTGDTFQLVATGATNTVTFAPGGVGTISSWSRGSAAANIEIGSSAGSSATSENFTADNGKLVFDVATTSSYDKVQVFGNATINNCSIVVNAISGYLPQVGDHIDAMIIAYGTEAGGYDYRATKGISGTGYSVLTAGWVASLVDASGNPGDDILRLTYVPEPATIALLSLGLIAIRRKK